MNRQIVVARYKEDLAWLKKVSLPTVVYDKGSRYGVRPQLPHISYEPLDNHPRGREAHTYLHHVVTCYDKLADWTFFVQGEPFYHYGPLLTALRADYKDTTGLSLFVLTEKNMKNLESQIQDRDSPVFNILVKRPRQPWWTGRFWKLLFPTSPAPYEFVFSSGAQFVVPRRRILQRPLSFYQRLLAELNDPWSPFDAWELETFWLYIFGDEHRGGYPDRIRRTPEKLWT